MPSNIKLIFSTIFIFVIIYSIVMIKVTDMEGENSNSGPVAKIAMVEGWGHNITRNTSQYILGNNLSAYILPEHFCDSESFLLVFICSGPANIEARSAIRETWGRPVAGSNMSLFFLLGETANKSLQADVLSESEKFGDIVQERFIDSYNNLTIKSVVMLKLVSSYCSNNTKYLLKIDDDMFSNLDLIIDMLLEQDPRSNFLTGKLICGAYPIKDSSNKWYSPHYMYPGKVYPNYLSGTSYLMSVDVAKKLYETALKTPIFHLEDVYLTGICAKKANIKARNNPLFTYQNLGYDICIIRKLYTAHRFSPEKLRKTYDQLKTSNLTSECEPRKGFKVNHWIVNHILKVNKPSRKRKCE